MNWTSSSLFQVHPWNQDLWAWLSGGHSEGAHAWLFEGPPGIGRHAIAFMLAEVLLGHDNRTRSLLRAGSHPDLHVVMPEIRATDDLLSAYAQRYFKIDAKPESKPKTVITIAQVRLLIERTTTRAHSGANKMVIIDFAERMNIYAANALLKLLEEPPPDTLFVLITDQASRLPATVRSRTSRVPFRPPAQALAVGWLQEQLGSDQDASLLLQMANGAPLQALDFAAGEEVEIRQTIASDFAALWRGQDDPFSLAARWHEIGLARVAPWLLKLLCDLVRGACGGGDPASLFNPEHAEWLAEIGKKADLTKAYALYDRLGVILGDLDGPLDQRLLMEDLAIELAALATH